MNIIMYVYSVYNIIDNKYIHGGMINRWPHQKESTLDDLIARNST